MDPVTHFTAGALSGRALADRLPGCKIMIFCLVAAGLPDIDSLVGFGPEHYLIHHRAFTHSVVGIPLLAALLAGVFKIFWRTVSFRLLFLIGLGIMSLQVYLDLMTTFGTQILWPFSTHRFALPGVFIIDPLFTVGLLLILILSLLLRRRRRVLGLLGLAVAIGYPLVNLGIGTALEHLVANQLRSRGINFSRIYVTTDLLTPLYWKFIAEDKGHYRVGATSVTLSTMEPTFVSFPKPDAELVRRLGEQAPFFRTWFWFARYPVVSSVKETDHGLEMTFLDLRFFSRSPIGRKIFPDYKPPFTLTARLNEQRKLKAYLYHRHGRTLVTRVPD